MTRALTPYEQTMMRSDGQAIRVRGLFVPQPTVFACQLSGSPLGYTDDGAVNYLPYTTPTSGSYGNIVSGMTVYVGSGSGASDLGSCRARSADSKRIKVARNTDIPFYPGCYLTVVDDFSFWERLPTLLLSSINMDDDVAYVDQNYNFDPVPVFGPDRAVPTSGPIAISGSGSYCYDSTITAYSWACTSGIISGSGASIVFSPAHGYNRLTLTVTAANGKSFTGHRTIMGYQDSDLIPLNINSMSGDASNGGWTAEIELWDNAALPQTKDRMKLFLIADDFYSGSPMSFGQIPEQEKVLMVGWIDGESIKYQSDRSSVVFQLQGAQYWMGQIPGPSGFLEASETNPTVWTSIKSMDIGRFCWHFFHWRSTVDSIVDVNETDNFRIVGEASFSIDSIMGQMSDTVQSRMMMELKCNRYSQVFLEQDPNLELDRSGTVLVETLTNDDFGEEIDITRVTVTPYAMVEIMAAVGYGDAASMVMARAPGSLVYKHYGTSKTSDKNIVTDQSDVNMLTGMWLAKLNNMYPEIDIKLAQNNRMIDIAPCMFLGFNASGSQNARNVGVSIRVIPEHIDYTFDAEKGKVTMNLTCVGETSGSPGVKVDQPDDPIYNFADDGASGSTSYNLTPFTGLNLAFPNLLNRSTLYGGIDSSSGSVACPTSSPATGPYNTYIAGLYDTSMTGRIIAKMPCWVRTSLHSNPTKYSLKAVFTKLDGTSGTYSYTPDDAWYDIWACDAAGNHLFKATHDAVGGSPASGSPEVRTGSFDAGAQSAQVSYFEVVLTKDSFNPISAAITGTEVDGGSQPTLGTTTWGRTPTGVWIHDTGIICQEPQRTKLFWQISGSPSSLTGQWFTVQVLKSKACTYVSGINYGNNPIGQYEVGYNPDFYWAWRTTYAGWDDAHHADFSPQMIDDNLVGGTLVPQLNSGVIQDTLFLQPTYPARPDLLCITEDFGLHVDSEAPGSYTVTRTIDMIITFKPTYKLQILELDISNVCPEAS